jgi:hypothetical protein
MQQHTYSIKDYIQLFKKMQIKINEALNIGGGRHNNRLIKQ